MLHAILQTTNLYVFQLQESTAMKPLSPEESVETEECVWLRNNLGTRLSLASAQVTVSECHLLPINATDGTTPRNKSFGMNSFY